MNCTVRVSNRTLCISEHEEQNSHSNKWQYKVAMCSNLLVILFGISATLALLHVLPLCHALLPLRLIFPLRLLLLPLRKLGSSVCASASQWWNSIGTGGHNRARIWALWGDPSDSLQNKLSRKAESGNYVFVHVCPNMSMFVLTFF